MAKRQPKLIEHPSPEACACAISRCYNCGLGAHKECEVLDLCDACDFEEENRFDGAVYIITNEPGTLVKIGFSENPYKRLSNLQTANPMELDLRLLFPGTYDDERWLHTEFAPQRLKGEWFKEEGKLKAFLDEMLAHPCRFRVFNFFNKLPPEWTPPGDQHVVGGAHDEER